MKRRNFLLSGTGLVLAPWWFQRQQGSAMATTEDLETGLLALRDNWTSYLPEGTDFPTPSTPLNITRDEWRERLSPDAFRVLFNAGTERAGSSPLDHETREGVFLCAACELPLFTSAMKYDSGTGWPSYFTSIPEHLGTSRDFKLILPRTEYHCIRCKGHQGHIFSDGPAPTGERWCNNGVALKFVSSNKTG